MTLHRPTRRHLLNRTGTLAFGTLGAWAGLPLLTGCGGGGSDDPAPSPPSPPLTTTAVTTWHAHVTATIDAAQAAGAGLFSNVEARAQAMVYAAIHDTLNAIDRRYAPWRVDVRDTSAHPDAAVAAAARDVLVALLPGQTGFVQPRYQAAIDAVAAGSAKTAGIALGRQVAAGVLSARQNDGAAQSEATYAAASTAAGIYQLTPDGNGGISPAVGVRWGQVQPFAMQSGSQFRASFDATRYGAVGPSALASAEYATELNKVKDVGARNSPTREPFATETARFWLENSPPQWMRLAVALARAKNLDGWDEARLYAALHIAMCDSLIACYESKYFYAFWRPITAVRGAADDGNGATVPDANWVQFTTATPPTPDYPSAHGAAGGAASAVFISIFGAGTGTPSGQDVEPDEDNNPFTLDSTTAPGVTRNYRGFRHAARENSLSRLYAGFHFSKAVYDGRQMGRDVGEFVMANALRRLMSQEVV
jgi:PAP2 superfamily